MSGFFPEVPPAPFRAVRAEGLTGAGSGLVIETRTRTRVWSLAAAATFVVTAAVAGYRAIGCLRS